MGRSSKTTSFSDLRTNERFLAVDVSVDIVANVSGAMTAASQDLFRDRLLKLNSDSRGWNCALRFYASSANVRMGIREEVDTKIRMATFSFASDKVGLRISGAECDGAHRGMYTIFRELGK
jgi:hypothetical protein